MDEQRSVLDRSIDVEESWLGGRIVVGIDGSQHSSNALKSAARIAGLSGARIEVVTAWQSLVATAPNMGPVRWSAGDRAHIAQQESIVSAFGSDIPESFVAFVREGAAAAVLLDVSRGADLLIVGRHGTSGHSGALMGSVSAACAERAHCAVLVIPEAGKHKPHRKT